MRALSLDKKGDQSFGTFAGMCAHNPSACLLNTCILVYEDTLHLKNHERIIIDEMQAETPMDLLDLISPDGYAPSGSCLAQERGVPVLTRDVFFCMPL
jgi:hypothetical protein